MGSRPFEYAYAVRRSGRRIPGPIRFLSTTHGSSSDYASGLRRLGGKRDILMILRRRTGDPQVSLSASPAQPPGLHASAIRATTASPSSGPAAASAAAGQFLACFSPSRAPALLAAANRSLHKECDPIEREAEVEDNARPPQTSAARAPSVRSRWRPREPRAVCATRQARSAHWPIRSCELLSAPRCEVTVASSICLRRLSLSEGGGTRDV